MSDRKGTPNKLPPLPERVALTKLFAPWFIASLGDLTDDYAAMTLDDVEMALLANGEYILPIIEALRQSQSLPAGAVAGLVGKWRKIASERGVVTFTGNDHALFANELEAALQSDAREKGEVIGWAAMDTRGQPIELFLTEAGAMAWAGWGDDLDASVKFAKAIPLYATQPAQASEKDFVDIDVCAMVSVMAAIEGRLKSEQGIPREQAHITRKEFNCLSRYMERYEHDTHSQPVTPAGGEVATAYVTPSGLDHLRRHDLNEVTARAWIGGDHTVPLYRHPPVADAALARDAERYRFIREQNAILESDAWVITRCDFTPEEGHERYWVGADLDLAVDEATMGRDAALNQRGGE